MLERIQVMAARTLGVIAGIALFAMMVLTFVDVIGRYGFHSSIFGTAEIVEYLMIVSVFAGLAFITAKNDHITVTLMEPLIERTIPGTRRWVSIALSVGCTLLITWQMFEHGFDLLESGKRSAVLDLPQWVQPMSAGILSLVGFLLLLVAVVRSRGRLGATSLHGD